MFDSERRIFYFVVNSLRDKASRITSVLLNWVEKAAIACSVDLAIRFACWVSFLVPRRGFVSYAAREIAKHVCFLSRLDEGRLYCSDLTD